MSESKTWIEKLRASIFGLGDTADEADVVISAKTLSSDLKAKKEKVEALKGTIDEKDEEITKLKADLEEAERANSLLKRKRKRRAEQAGRSRSWKQL
ncbi:hypothetical protein [Thiohalophilus sp.]|uniref:hypothetical protein n=1 Tax=Thiohalophilus sp. TaxID=3028392 RepID=UPI002ACED9AB|nr:hypothetical protein [Thiohalophilus sp.]MDZ7802368.1 hypothetical protein [Thiohalophilus sp.]